MAKLSSENPNSNLKTPESNNEQVDELLRELSQVILESYKEVTPETADSGYYLSLILGENVNERNFASVFKNNQSVYVSSIFPYGLLKRPNNRFELVTSIFVTTWFLIQVHKKALELNQLKIYASVETIEMAIFLRNKFRFQAVSQAVFTQNGNDPQLESKMEIPIDQARVLMSQGHYDKLLQSSAKILHRYLTMGKTKADLIAEIGKVIFDKKEFEDDN